MFYRDGFQPYDPVEGLEDEDHESSNHVQISLNMKPSLHKQHVRLVSHYVRLVIHYAVSFHDQSFKNLRKCILSKNAFKRKILVRKTETK